jgi:hypothetical protein
MECTPTDRVDTANVAVPPVSDLEPIWVTPSNKVTVPVGVQLYCGATVTVNVTICWNTDGFAFEVTPVVVFALFTCNVNACEPEFDLESVTVAVTLERLATHAVPASVGEVLRGCCEMPDGRPVAVHVNGAVPPSSVSVSL